MYRNTSTSYARQRDRLLYLSSSEISYLQSWEYRCEFKHTMKSRVKLKSPFFEFTEDKFVCLQPLYLVPLNATEKKEICLDTFHNIYELFKHFEECHAVADESLLTISKSVLCMKTKE